MIVSHHRRRHRWTSERVRHLELRNRKLEGINQKLRTVLRRLGQLLVSQSETVDEMRAIVRRHGKKREGLQQIRETEKELYVLARGRRPSYAVRSTLYYRERKASG